MVEQPYYLGLLWQMRHYQLPYRAGGLEDQPHLVMMALNACEEAEQESALFRQRVEEAQRKATASSASR